MHLQRREAPPTDGTLFRPGGPSSVRGGWRRPATRWLALGGLGAVAVAGLVALRR
jgi:hypothetical protein